MTDTTNPSLAAESVAPEETPVPQSVPTPAFAEQAQQQQYLPVQQVPVFMPQAQNVFIVKPAPTKKGFGITSMVLGISAVIFSWTAIFAFIMLALAFVFGAISLKKGETPRGFAITGIVLGSFAVLLVGVIIAIVAMFFGAVATVGTATY